MKKRYLVLICIVLTLPLLLVACNGTGNGFKYKSAFSMAKFDTSGIIIEKYEGTDKEVVVPNTINNKEVRYISPYTFTGTGVEIIKFQNRICNESSNFQVYEALNLKKLYLPNNDWKYFIAHYDGGAHISGCSKLEEIHFPPLFNSFGTYERQYYSAIKGCNNLRKIYFYGTHSVVWIKEIGTLFESDLPKTFYDDLTIYVPQNLISEYRLHDIWKNFNLATFDAVWIEP